VSTAIVERRRGRLRWLAAEPAPAPGINHGFTLRGGGASRGAFSSLNFSSREGTSRTRARELAAARGGGASSRPRLGAALAGARRARRAHRRRGGFLSPPPQPPGGGRHGDRPARTGARRADRGLPAGGARRPRHGRRRDRACRLARHARGGRGGSGARALRSRRRRAQGCRRCPRPVIGACCYEVGDEVREAFRRRWGAAHLRGLFTRAAGWRLDLQPRTCGSCARPACRRGP